MNIKTYCKRGYCLGSICIAMILILHCSEKNPSKPSNTAPTASFTIIPTWGYIETIFNFDASGCSDAEDQLFQLWIRWDWEDDGVWDTEYLVSKQATHQYTVEGTKTIKLEVKDLNGLTNTTSRIVTVKPGIFDFDGNFYRIIKVGNQWWMAENLKVTHYRNGDAIPNVTDSTSWTQLITGAYCSYDNSEANASAFGRLYNWYAVSDSRNIAPPGWHVPNDDEWKQLEIYLGMSQEQADKLGDRGTNEGGKLKEAGRMNWDSPNTGATNESCFTALPGGFRTYSSGIFVGRGYTAYFWTSTEHLNRILSSTNGNVRRVAIPNTVGSSVRCVKD